MRKHSWRCQQQLPPLSFKDYSAAMLGERAGVTTLIARSPTTNPPPSDWPEELRANVIGDLVLDVEAQTQVWPPSASLVKFLDDCGDSPPVYVGCARRVFHSNLRVVGRRLSPDICFLNAMKPHLNSHVSRPQHAHVLSAHTSRALSVAGWQGGR